MLIHRRERATLPESVKGTIMTPQYRRGFAFDGKVVLVTGAATGIGRAVAARCAGGLGRAEEVLAQLDRILPALVPGRGHRTEVALAHGQLDLALALITPMRRSLPRVASGQWRRATLNGRHQRIIGCSPGGPGQAEHVAA